MKKICAKGYKISEEDQKALDEYLMTPFKEWIENALIGMVNKAIKTIMRDWFVEYKKTQKKAIAADLSVIIPAIVALPNFKPYNTQTPEFTTIDRNVPVSKEVISGGLDIEDYQKVALDAYYANPEEILDWFINNKIHMRRKAFVEMYENELIKDPKIKTIPANQDDLINLVTSNKNYKTRKQKEEAS